MIVAVGTFFFDASWLELLTVAVASTFSVRFATRSKKVRGT